MCHINKSYMKLAEHIKE